MDFRGFGDTSVREMVSGCRTTRDTEPPLPIAPLTCPSSCTAIIASPLSTRMEATNISWRKRFILRPLDGGSRPSWAKPNRRPNLRKPHVL